ncbi:MAG: hypothetical protein M3P04_12955 [Actinomycetota bacterium]|nr:hypothetical protein [Actinomycetota bacterium]
MVEETLDPPRVAELVAPHLARLRDVISERLTPHVPALVERYGIDRATGTIIALLRNQPPEASFPADALAEAFSNAPAPSVWQTLHACIKAGLLEPAGPGMVRRTPLALVFSGELVELATQVAVDLWSGHRELVTRLVFLLEKASKGAAADPGARLKVFDWPQHGAGTPDEYVFAELLASMRYHRGDVLARVCAAEGLTPDEALVLPPGRARDAVERRTNRLAGRPYALLDLSEGAELVGGLAVLPS